MKKLLKIFCLILSVTVIFSSCKRDENKPTEETVTEGVTSNESVTDNEEAKKETVALPCNFSDGFNPFFASSYENLYLCSLLYEPLFSVDSHSNTKSVVGKDAVLNGNILSVNLNTNHSCRGSSPVDAYDVVYSFNLAKASYGYGSYLQGVASAAAVEKWRVDFTLDYPNINAWSKLIFPVVKAGTADGQTDIPTGSGRYYLNGQTLVSKNDGKKINLCSVSESNSASDAFKIGNLDIYFSDLADCRYSAIAGKTEDVLLNNMVYLGLNSAHGALDKNVRSAIAVCIDSEDIAKFSYEGHAQGVKLPVSPQDDGYKELAPIGTGSDKKLASEILDRAGFLRYSGKAKTNGKFNLAFNLIVNNENKFRMAAAYNIADSLNSIGFYITVVPLSFDEYSKRIESGSFDMYLGEVKLDPSQDIAGFFKDGVQYGMGIDKTAPSAVKYFEYLAGKLSAKEYYNVFMAEYPFVPVCFKKGYVVSSKGVDFSKDGMPFDLYGNL